MLRKPIHWAQLLLCLALLLLPHIAWAQLSTVDPVRPTIVESILDSPNPTEQQEYLSLHHQLRIVGFLSLLALIPTVVVMMTSFTRITIIFHFLRQALATQYVPSNQLVMGLSLILTGFVMHPVIEQIQTNAIEPYFSEQLKEVPEVKMGIVGEDRVFVDRAWEPLRTFMLRHAREKDLQLFLDIGHIELPNILPEDMAAHDDDGTGSAYDLSAVPWYALVPAFVMSELRIAFMMGFLLFLPFLVIDMVIASILMSMGMMMLPPVMISMPFKLLLFILVDGWRLVIEQTVNSFYPV
jgi:flagellar biosynthetic protein FliP